MYGRGVASTVHSFYGLGTAEIAANMILERSTAIASLVNKIPNVDVIIWDEASMSSSRILELVNLLHHSLAVDANNMKPFAGKQIVLVGEFLQLRPVPNRFDEGSFLFNSHVFGAAISYRIQLKQIMRQSPDEIEFAIALKQILVGNCTTATLNFVTSLSRELHPDQNKVATHIFFRKAPTILYNRGVVDSLLGESIRLEAEFSGVTNNIIWPGEETVILKEGARVMLVWNKSNSLKNGTMGVFVGMDKHTKALVQFENEGIVPIGKETWNTNDERGQKIGSVCQYPVIVAYAITCHKSQGLTLDSVVVHCATEYLPGLIYVLSSRVRSASHIQMVNFKPVDDDTRWRIKNSYLIYTGNPIILHLSSSFFFFFRK